MDVSPTIQHLHGRIRSIPGTDPAAGAEILETVPARRRWRILAFTFDLTTDANAANRLVRLEIKDPTQYIYRHIATTAHTASLTHKYSYCDVGFSELSIATVRVYPLPTFILTAGMTIGTSTAAKEDDDNFTPPNLLVEEWIDP